LQAFIADYAGFCAGVRRAFQIATETTTEDGSWYTLGPLVHNDTVIDYFKSRGISPVNSVEQVDMDNSGIILRAHGVSPVLIHEATEKGLMIKDATCPLVKRVHDIVLALRGEGYEIVIFGELSHPEVQGILGWCDNKARVISSVHKACNLKISGKIGLVSQTTKDEKEFFKVANTLLSQASELRIYNTICSATKKRQQSARKLCQDVDLMLVIGDRMSSNTTTLFKECIDTGVKTFQIQGVSEIETDWLKGVSRVGITAGASTPDWIIKEVLSKMTEYGENTNQDQNAVKGKEESFANMEAEMADFVPPSRGDIIKGTVIQVLDDEVMVDVGGKSEGIIPLREMSIKEIDSAKELVQVGDTIEVLVLKWDDDGSILLSKKKVDSKKVLDSLEEDFKEGRIIEGRVSSSVKGGLLVDIGIIAFLPASHVEDGYVKNLDDYIDKTYKFKIIEFNRNKRRGSQIVVSRKELVSEEKARLKEKFWQDIEEGQIIEGKVKRIVDYGAFIDLGGYEGLLHISEFDHKRVEHPSDVLHEGDVLDVFILSLDRQKERVSLSRKKLLKSPWEIVVEKYSEGDIIDGKVVRIAPFGAFVEIEPGVDGLIHISQLADYRVEKPEDVVSVNQDVKVKILSIDPKEKRVGLSLKEAIHELEAVDVEEYLDSQDEDEFDNQAFEEQDQTEQNDI